jgi:hypothetical protein
MPVVYLHFFAGFMACSYYTDWVLAYAGADPDLCNKYVSKVLKFYQIPDFYAQYKETDFAIGICDHVDLIFMSLCQKLVYYAFTPQD